MTASSTSVSVIQLDSHTESNDIGPSAFSSIADGAVPTSSNDRSLKSPDQQPHIHKQIGSTTAVELLTLRAQSNRNDLAASSATSLGFEHSVELRNSSSSSISNDNDEEDNEEYPEGGRDAWTVVFGSFLGLIAVFGLVNSLGAVQAYVSVNQLSTKSESQVSWIFSVFVFFSFLFTGQVGPIYDLYGPYHLSVLGAILFTLGLMTVSLCTQYYQFFLSFSVCCGIGTALLMTPEVAIIGHWFNKKRGTAIGAATVGGSLGGVIFPIMLRQLYTIVGFPWAIRILGFISMLLLTASIALMKPRLLNEQSAPRKFKLSLETLIDYKSLKDMRFTWLIIANFLGELGVINGLTFLTSYALAQGKSEEMSYALLAILNSLGMVGRIVPGIIADRLGRFNTLIATTAAASITIFAIWLPFGHTSAGLIVFAILHGFCNGGIYSLAPVCCGQVCKTRDYGKRYGSMYFFASITILLGVPLSGSLIRNGNDYTRLVIFNGCVYVGTTIALILSRYCAVGFRWCKW